MNGKAAKNLRIMTDGITGDKKKDRQIYQKLKKKHNSLPWNKRYVRGLV